ncbi:hypothetical protein [Clostridium cylindrosporum]|uniref:Uncharacterized protein n=1 Tax=Clostridium cylindrosporum DSM 605 TaxID=1121307 RepID=A0A0J8DFT3_CLOCY|nr:hypothetical protein [Clostridium cylindrosporum]KMT23099.1 hypothetical protein CLCY_7c01460 [Clostridium cylindrosporum DSM 605]
MTDNIFYKSMPKSQLLSPLARGEYGFIYESLKEEKTFSYIDENNNINLVANCGNRNIMTILKAKKSIYIDKHALGALIQVKFLEYGFSFDFVYDVYNNYDYSIVNSIINSSEGIIINFLINYESGYSKAFHLNFDLDDKLKERLNYIKDTTFNLQYPRIDLEIKNENEKVSRFLEYEYNLKIVEDVIEACDKLCKWKSSDNFIIYMSYDKNITLYLSEECKNFNFIKSELSSKYNLIDEGEKVIKGVPLLKYDRGYLYFNSHKD